MEIRDYGTLPLPRKQLTIDSAGSSRNMMSSHERATLQHRPPTDPSDTFQDEEEEMGSIESLQDSRASSTSAARIWTMIQDRRRIHDEGPQQPSQQHRDDINDNDPSVSSSSRSNHHRQKWTAIGFGQLIAIIATTMNASSFTLTDNYGVNTQFFQMFLMYSLLSFNLQWRRQAEAIPSNGDEVLTTTTTTQMESFFLPFTSMRLKMPWWIYLIMSVLDVFPNFMALFSFHYTSLTSTTLLGSLTAPATMIFSKVILKRLFGRYQYMGVALCLVGGAITVWADAENSLRKHSFIGDILAIGAAILYGFGDTVAEYFSKHVDRFEYLGMLGAFGAVFTGFGALVLEREAIAGITRLPAHEKLEVSGLMVTYVLSVLFYYLAEARFLVSSDATLLNLSMQAQNLWAIVFSVIIYHEKPAHAFYYALVFVVAGVFIYEMGGSCGRRIETEEDKRQTVLTNNNDNSNNERQERIERPLDMSETAIS